MTQFEYAAATVRDPAPLPWEEEAEQTVSEAAEMFKAAMVSLIEVCDSPLRLAVAVARFGGLSYQEIGAKYGISRQGIHKHILAIARKNPALSEALKCRFLAQEAIAGDLDLAKFERDFEAEIRRVKNA